MVNQGRTTAQFPVKASLYDNQDYVVIVYAQDSANSSNTGSSQTAIITANNLFGNSAAFGVNAASINANNLLILNIPTSNPHVNNALWSNGGVLTISSG